MGDRTDLAALILAAGEGTRMKSGLAKVLHEVCGKAMIRCVIETVNAVSPSRIVIVVGHQADSVREELEGEEVEFILQKERLGTGHAALMSGPLLGDFSGTIVVLNGDTPLLKPETLGNFIEFHREAAASATVLSALLDDPSGYGRIIRDVDGGFVRIVEHKDATEAERKVKEINSGIFCFEGGDLFSSLEEVGRRNVQGEYYITDVMEILKNGGKRVAVYLSDQKDEVLGINDAEQLKAAERLMAEDG
ncbi:MAG: NTP transferase domain-containing protein [Candidatus Krumholzibacteria bacterium]|nr:NTP transferase domain-containing protein [Candidatus Krumholzibacteria bacterium]